MKERTVEDLREAAWEAMEEDPDKAVRLAQKALRQCSDAEGHYVLGAAQCEAGEDEAGISSLRTAIELDNDHVDAWAALGRALFDAAEWEDARAALNAALRLDPHHPDAHYSRACLRERRGDHDGALRDYHAAHAEAPDTYPLPVPLDDATISAVADEVIGQLHPSLQKYLDSVAILVDEVPPAEILGDFDPPARPAELLGSFNGHSLPERSGFAPWSTLPATIVLYRRNLSRIASDHEELVEQLRITLLHEIGHFLGLEEDDLAARGLD